MHKFLVPFLSSQFIRFLFTGGFAACVNFGSRFFYNRLMDFGEAVLVAYATGMITAYILAKLFVFEKSIHTTTKEFFYFAVVNLAAVAQTYIVSIGLANYLFPFLSFDLYPKAVAHGIGIIIPVFTSFVGHKHLSFKSNNHAV